MADAPDKPDAASAAAPTPAPAAAGGAPIPAAKPEKSVDPFAGLSTAEAARKELAGAGGDEVAKTDDKTDDKAGEKKDDKAAAGDKTAGAKPGEKVVAGRKDAVAEQRARIEQQNQVIEKTQRERDDYKRQLEETRKQGGGDVGVLTKAVADSKKEIERLTGELAKRDYSTHPDFKSKFEKPFSDAAEYAREIVESLKVQTGVDDEEKPVLRQAEWKDFAKIYSLPRAAAVDMAEQMFGKYAGDVMRQFDDVHRSQRAKDNALTEWQTGATEREQKTREEQLMETKKMGDAFNSVTNDFIESDPLFQEKPEDAERTALWNKSQEIVDRAYFGRDKFSKTDLAVLDAAVRLRAINEPVLRAKLAQVQAELAEYKERVEGKEKSTNGKTRKTGETPAAGAKPEAWDKELISSLKSAV